MPMSLKCMINKWLHKNQISQEEYDAVIKKLEGHDKQIRAEAIDEAIKTLAKSEDTILSDRQYYTLIELKERMKNEQLTNSVDVHTDD